MLEIAGIPHQGKGKGPRVHDLRHSAAIHSLASMANNGLDLYYCLPLLSCFLGHKSIESIDVYVRLTEEMYPDLLHKMEGINSFIFQEFNDENQ
jgi:integrase